jgi:EpsI family protein
MSLSKYRLVALNAALTLALTASVWGSRTANSTTAAQRDFLHPRPFSDWNAAPLTLTERERELLKPDAVLLRRYTSPDRTNLVDLAVIAGHRKQTVHTPGFCLTGGGWETLDTADHVVRVGGKEIPAIRSVMGDKGREMLVIYFFTDGEFSTRSLIRYQAAQMLKRARSEAPMGALVRIIVPVRADREDAGKTSRDFARAMLPDILDDIRRARGKG